MTDLQFFLLLAFFMANLALLLSLLRGQKQVEKRLRCLEEKPCQTDFDTGYLALQNLQEQMEKGKAALLDAFKSLVDLVEIHTTKSSLEILKELRAFPSQISLLKKDTELFQKKSREMQEESWEKSLQSHATQWNSFYKKFHQTLRESGAGMLEYWEQDKIERKKEREEGKKNLDALLASWKNCEARLAEQHTKERMPHPENFILLEKRLAQIMEALKPLFKEVISWQKDPLARRKDLENRKLTFVLEEKLPPLVAQPMTKPSPRVQPQIALVENEAESEPSAPHSVDSKETEFTQKPMATPSLTVENKVAPSPSVSPQAENDALPKPTASCSKADTAAKITALLTEIHKHRMQFLGASLQEEVLRAIHSFFLREKSCPQSALIPRLMEQDLKPILQKGTLTKTKITSIVNILRKGKCFELFREEEEAIQIRLVEKFQDYKALRKTHDQVFITIAQEIGIPLTSREWALFLYEIEEKNL